MATAQDHGDGKATTLKTLFKAERLRLLSGLILMVFLTTHLLNHTLGLFL